MTLGGTLMKYPQNIMRSFSDPPQRASSPSYGHSTTGSMKRSNTEVSLRTSEADRRSINGWDDEDDDEEGDEEQDDVSDAGRSDAGSRVGEKGFDEDSFEGVEKRTLEQAISNYLWSKKGRAMSHGASLMYSIVLITIGFTLLLSKELSPGIIDTKTTSIFSVLLFGVSSMCIVLLLILGVTGYLTHADDHYLKVPHKTVFLRSGMIVLASGGLLYYGTQLWTFLSPAAPDCEYRNYIIMRNACALIFTLLQVTYLLKYFKVHINRSLSLAILSQFMLMTVIATNMVVWLQVIVDETIEEMHAFTDTNEYQENVETTTTTYRRRLLASGGDGGGNGTLSAYCHSSGIETIIAPYTYVLLVEFSLLASTLVLAGWEKCGNGLKHHHHHHLQPAQDDPKIRRISEINRMKQKKKELEVRNAPTGFINSNWGMASGWICLVCALLVTIVCLYGNYTQQDYLMDKLDYIIYGTNVSLSLVCMVVIPITARGLSKLTFKDEEIRHVRKGVHAKAKRSLHRKLDQDLLSGTVIAVMAYKIMTVIAAADSRNYILAVDGFVSIIMGFMQVAFINWYAVHKRSSCEEHRRLKPGRQGLEFLRIANLALWLINTFLLKNSFGKTVQVQAFSEQGWLLISNVLQPLTILFYFHSMICIADIVARVYSEKYVGVVRPSKHQSRSRAQSLLTSPRPNTVNGFNNSAFELNSSRV